MTDLILKSQANFEHSENEIECLKLQGEQNLIKHIKALEEKDSRISDLQLKLDKAQSDADEDNLKDKDDFREMDSMEGGLVDVRNQVEIAAEVIKVEFTNMEIGNIMKLEYKRIKMEEK